MNAAVSTLPTADKELTVTVNIPSVMESDAKVLQARVESATVEYDQSYLTLTDFLGQVALRRTALEADRVKLKKPVLQLGKDIEEMFRTPLLILHDAIYLGKQKLLAYDELKRAEAGQLRPRHRSARRRRRAKQLRSPREPLRRLLRLPVYGAGEGPGPGRQFAKTCPAHELGLACDGRR